MTFEEWMKALYGDGWALSQYGPGDMQTAWEYSRIENKEKPLTALRLAELIRKGNPTHVALLVLADLLEQEHD